MYCYATHNYRNFSNAGNISKNFIEHIMQDMGFRNVAIHQTHFHNKVIGFFATLAGVCAIPFRLHKGDVIVLQYPIKKYYTLICKVAHIRGAKVITLVHDLGCCRRKKITPETEMHRLNNSDALIIHNPNMKRWILEHGYKGGIAVHHMFDYTAPAEAKEHRYGSERPKILYAGSLPKKKNAFLYTLAQNELNYDLELYGKGFDGSQVKNNSVHYHGYAKDTELIENNSCNFGLVWDGNSLDACEGAYGGYLKLNNPIKTSLYIRCHLPVIVWKEAAIAPFVKEKGLGICIDTLRDLDRTLAAITPEQYAQMERNVAAWSKELKRGTCTRNAINECLEYLGYPQAGE